MQRDCLLIGPTKTLAKLANAIAKSAERKSGSYPADHAQICHLGGCSREELQALLAATEVGVVWSFGPKIYAQLRAQGIHTALDLQRMSSAAAKADWSLVLEKTVHSIIRPAHQRTASTARSHHRICVPRRRQEPGLEHETGPAVVGV